MKSISLRSPAKLNLFLKVVNKRRDGYHNLITLFERIDLFDDIKLTLNSTGKIRILCNDPHVPKGPKNIAYHVARRLQDDYALGDGVDIKITKRIPVAAGLGGGSSNAASVLLGLSQLWKLSLTKKELLYYAKAAGSDVPFFINNIKWALGRQRGDTIKKVKISKKIWHILVIPALKVYSREVFGAFNFKLTRSASAALLRKAKQREPSVSTLSALKHEKAGRTNMLTKTNDDVNILIHALRKGDLPNAGQHIFNDLEKAIVKRYPRLYKIKEILRRFNVEGVAFSGSGPSVYGIVGSKHEAEAIKTTLKKYYRRVFVVGTY